MLVSFGALKKNQMRYQIKQRDVHDLSTSHSWPAENNQLTYRACLWTVGGKLLNEGVSICVFLPVYGCCLPSKLPNLHIQSFSN